MVFYLPGIPVCILPNRSYFHNWVPQIALESGFVVIIILDNHPLAIAFRYFCLHWDALVAVIHTSDRTRRANVGESQL